MTRYEDQCCDCAVPGYPCRGELCDLRHVPVLVCDECGSEYEERLYVVDGEELCYDCKERRLNPE